MQPEPRAQLEGRGLMAVYVGRAEEQGASCPLKACLLWVGLSGLFMRPEARQLPVGWRSSNQKQLTSASPVLHQKWAKEWCGGGAVSPRESSAPYRRLFLTELGNLGNSSDLDAPDLVSGLSSIYTFLCDLG